MRAPPANAHWRDSARASKLWIFNSTATFPMMLMLFHIRLWTFELAVAIMSILTLIEHYGFSLPVFGRWIRSTMAGKRKIATPWWL